MGAVENLKPEVRAALLFALWHHQGSSSQVGQPIRAMLGIGEHDALTPEQLAAARGFLAMTLVRQAVTGFYGALDRRENGDVAMHKAFREIEQALGTHWVPHVTAKLGAAPPPTREMEPSAPPVSSEELFAWLDAHATDVRIRHAWNDPPNPYRFECIFIEPRAPGELQHVRIKGRTFSEAARAAYDYFNQHYGS